jgi:hypothetical protein
LRLCTGNDERGADGERIGQGLMQMKPGPHSGLVESGQAVNIAVLFI